MICAHTLRNVLNADVVSSGSGLDRGVLAWKNLPSASPACVAYVGGILFKGGYVLFSHLVPAFSIVHG